MKPLVVSLALVAAVALGWIARSRLPGTGSKPEHSGPQSASLGGKVLFYQSPMHPWIRSDKPGKCTVCGMDLVPVYAGDAPGADHTLSLASNSVAAIGIQIASVKRQAIERTFRFVGTIDDDDSRHRILSAYVEGRIDALFLHHDGAEIAAGDRLASVYSAPLLAAVREYLTLNRSLVGSASDQTPLLSGAQNRLRRMGLSQEQIDSLPATFTPDTQDLDIRSPMGGTVVKRLVYAGQYVKEGDSLFELGDFSVMWVKFDAFERDLAWLRPGETAEITTPALPGLVFTNQIRFIDPNLDPTSASAKVRIELPNPFQEGINPRQRLLRHRLSADVRVRVSVPDRLALPRSAVLNPGGSPRVFVELTPGRYALRSLRLGRVGDSMVEVISGLTVGDRVVSQGGFLLDAQAQLAGLNPSNEADAHSFAESNSPSEILTPAGVQSASVASWTDVQRGPIRTVIATADSVVRALSEDDLHAFHSRLATLRKQISTLPPQPEITALATVAAVIPDLAHQGATLEEARRAFFPLSQRLVEVGRQLRTRASGFDDVRLFQCPMTRRAFPDAPATASWMQLDRAQHNPWLGREMPDCGTELQP